jgi:membrane-bound lytic murein transglycosylase D
MRKFIWLMLCILFTGLVFAQQKESKKQIKIFPDEYSELDDVPVSQQIDDPLILKSLERARVKYLRALSYIENNDTLKAEENFEQAIDILNSINYYPNINKYRDYTDLVQSILEDYEKYIRNIDNLDESSSLFILRETLTKELEKTSRTKQPKVGTFKPLLKDTTKHREYTYQIPMDENEYVNKSIEFLTQKPIGRKFVRNSLVRSTVWGNIVKKIIEEEGMPPELFYLAMVESGFNPFAVSRAKAVGMWQFIMQTGQLYGLNASNSPWIDERRDPVKSTRAAMRHLRDLYNELGDWHLAIAAYNCGINAVQRAIAKYNNPDSVNFWNIIQYLPRETRNYVPLFIATVKVVNNLEDYGFSKSEVEYLPEIQFDKYTLNEPVSLTSLAKCANISVERLRELNPELLFSFTPPDVESYELRIPYGSKQTFVANYLNLTPEEKQPYLSYQVGRKETVESIAKKYNIAPEEILLVNNISSEKKTLKRGMMLKIPIVQTSTASDETKAIVASNTNPTALNLQENDKSNVKAKEIVASTNGTQKIVRYIVKENDNLQSISEKYGVSIDSIIAWNELKSRNLVPGSALRIYVRESSTAPASLATASVSPKDEKIVTKKENSNLKSDEPKVVKSKETKLRKKTHTVRKGETLESIAATYGVTTEQLLDWNPQIKKRKHKILAGEKLQLGDGAYTAETKKSKKAGNTQKTKYHYVKKGETLSDISKRYGVSLKTLKQLNPNISVSRIKAGDKIRVN